MKTIFFKGFCLSLSFLVIGLFQPPVAHADATASSQLSFTNITIAPSAGVFGWVTNWQGAAFAQAGESNQYNAGGSPSASAQGDYSLANGQADATSATALGGASASVIGQN